MSPVTMINATRLGIKVMPQIFTAGLLLETSRTRCASYDTQGGDESYLSASLA